MLIKHKQRQSKTFTKTYRIPIMSLTSSSSTSLATVMATSTAFHLIGSKFAAASTVLSANIGKKPSSFETTPTRFLGEECMPFSSRFRQNKTDTGILGCTDPNSICVKDTLSSLGGRCISQDAGRRELQDAEDYCTEKCTGNGACEGLSQDFDQIQIQY